MCCSREKYLAQNHVGSAFLYTQWWNQYMNGNLASCLPSTQARNQCKTTCHSCNWHVKTRFSALSFSVSSKKLDVLKFLSASLKSCLGCLLLWATSKESQPHHAGNCVVNLMIKKVFCWSHSSGTVQFASTNRSNVSHLDPPSIVTRDTVPCRLLPGLLFVHLCRH